MHIQALSEIYNQARNLGIVETAREFSVEYLGQNENYYSFARYSSTMVPPWTVAALIAALRALRDRVGVAVRPAIEVMIADAERGLEISSRYRYR